MAGNDPTRTLGISRLIGSFALRSMCFILPIHSFKACSLYIFTIKHMWGVVFPACFYLALTMNSNKLN